MRLPELPVREAVGPLARALETRRCAVLVAPPGAGKTTVVPLALLDSAWLEGGKIVVLEPRRLAARAAARRMASLLGEGVGVTVGYRIRRDTRVGPDTRVEVVTEGVLTRMLQADPTLEGVGLVVFDEFHERSVHADLGLALALQAQRLLREDLRLLVMSATLDALPVAELLGGGEAAPVIESHGKSHAVETVYLDRTLDGRIEQAVAARVRGALASHEGDVLVFLPGAGEIRRTAALLGARDRAMTGGVDLYPLFGDLSAEQQDRAIAPSPAGRRKVVLATAIAQTSLTIEGVRVVIDSGLMRVPRFDPGTGMSGLATLRVTADVAEQRRGRAGRTAPGMCYRLWTEGEQRGLVPRLRAEILDADLAPLMLELALWGAGANELDWLDPPPAAGREQAVELLRELEAVDAGRAITEHGRRMAGLGVHPRLAHMLLRAAGLGLSALACDIAALLGERDLLRRDGGPPDADLRLRLEALRRGRRAGSVAGHEVHRGRLERALAESQALYRALPTGQGARGTRAQSLPNAGGERARRAERLPNAGRKPAIAPDDIARTGEVLALAYPDRVAKRREAGGATAGAGSVTPPRSAAGPGRPHGARYLLRNGRGAALSEAQSLATQEWLAVADTGDQGAEARIFQAAPIEPEQLEALFGEQIEEIDEVRWNADAGRVEATRQRRLGALVLSEAPLAEPASARVTAALLDGVRAAGLHVLPWNKKTRQLRERLQFMHHADPETWPDVGELALLATLPDWLAPFLSSVRRLDELARLDLTEVLWTHVGWQLRPALDELAPTHLEVPSGSRIPLDYADPAAPALAVRLQEVFGWRETPRIGGGRVPVTLRLLSPAQRPMQVTTDLASFWRDAYFEVKKELKGRYPKHYWPDDPLTAQPTRRVRPEQQ